MGAARLGVIRATLHHSPHYRVVLCLLLALCCTQAGKLELEQRVFSLREVLVAAVEIVKVNAMNKNVRIEVEVPDELPKLVVGDQQRL